MGQGYSHQSAEPIDLEMFDRTEHCEKIESIRNSRTQQHKKGVTDTPIHDSTIAKLEAQLETYLEYLKSKTILEESPALDGKQALAEDDNKVGDTIKTAMKNEAISIAIESSTGKRSRGEDKGHNDIPIKKAKKDEDVPKAVKNATLPATGKRSRAADDNGIGLTKKAKNDEDVPDTIKNIMIISLKRTCNFKHYDVASKKSKNDGDVSDAIKDRKITVPKSLKRGHDDDSTGASPSKKFAFNTGTLAFIPSHIRSRIPLKFNNREATTGVVERNGKMVPIKKISRDALGNPRRIKSTSAIVKSSTALVPTKIPMKKKPLNIPDMPSEVRLKVFEYYMSINTDSKNDGKFRGRSPALIRALRTSKKQAMYFEAMEAFYKSEQVYTLNQRNGWSFCQMKPDIIQKIRKIAIEIKFHHPPPTKHPHRNWTIVPKPKKIVKLYGKATNIEEIDIFGALGSIKLNTVHPAVVRTFKDYIVNTNKLRSLDVDFRFIDPGASLLADMRTAVSKVDALLGVAGVENKTEHMRRLRRNKINSVIWSWDAPKGEIFKQITRQRCDWAYQSTTRATYRAYAEERSWWAHHQGLIEHIMNDRFRKHHEQCAE
ncbi:hypothetical protein B0O99DRAFT_593934 [Bisporella sp. PMI_857]|nr:hypothetical protein B0O99DRAFT_593934 [Bisporella sp. PMI_857]